MKLKSLNVALAILISLGVVACKSNDNGPSVEKEKVVNSGSTNTNNSGGTSSTGGNNGGTSTNTGGTDTPATNGGTSTNTGGTDTPATNSGTSTNTGSGDNSATNSGTDASTTTSGNNDTTPPSNNDATGGGNNTEPTTPPPTNDQTPPPTTDNQPLPPYGDGSVTVTFKNHNDLTQQEQFARDRLTQEPRVSHEWNSTEELDPGAAVAGYNQPNSYYLVIRDGANEKQLNDFILVVKEYTPISKRSDLESPSLNATYTGKASGAINKDGSLDVLGMDMTFNLNNGNISGKGVKLDDVDEQGVGMLIETIFASAPINVENGHITFKGSYSVTEGKAVAKGSDYERKEEAKTILNGGEYDGVFAGSNGEEVIGKFKGKFNSNAGNDVGKENYGAFGLKKSN